MKKLLVVFMFSILSVPSIAKADVIFCVVSGKVLLQIENHDSAVGHIGSQEVFLVKYQNNLYGRIAGLSADLYIHGRYVVGNIDGKEIHWSYAKGGIISGYQPCIYNTVSGER